jgi:NAD(P)-dependent dehydrogenase (short-subunit alcohol dehydrogenase family)
VNLDGAFYFAQAVARQMVQEGIAGRIVNIGSVNSLAAEKDSAAYCAAKGGILLLTKSMAVDLGPHGILVNCVAPGPIAHEGTQQYFDAEPLISFIQKGVPVRRPGSPAEIGETVAFLASPRNTYLTGACLVVDGGLTSYLRHD